MQKKLIAAAVAALVSTGAMAEATVYGRIDIGYSTADTDTTDGAGVTSTTKTTTTGAQSALTTTRLGVNAKEDLGGGLSAFGNLELGVNGYGQAGKDPNNAGASTTTNDGFFNNNPFNVRTYYVGLSSAAAGSVTLGRQWVLVDQVMGLGNSGGLNNAVGSMYAGIGKLNNTRSSNLITYSSPKFSGFSFDVSYGNGKTDTAGSVEQWNEIGLRVAFSTGPLSVALGHNAEESKVASAVVAEPTQLALAATYDFGFLKLYGTYMDGDDPKSGLNGRDGIELGITAPLGATTLIASIYTGESDGVAAANDRDHSGLQLGVKHALSKATSVYALYGSDKNETQNALNATEKTQLAFGVAHVF